MRIQINDLVRLGNSHSQTAVAILLLAFVLALQPITADSESLALTPQDGHSAQVTAVAFSSDGRFVVTGSEDHTAKLWEAASGVELRTFAGHLDYVSSVAFSPDGRFILTGSWDHTAKLWNVGTGAEIRSLTGHAGTVDAVAFSPDGHLALTGSEDGTARLWDVKTGLELVSFVGHDLHVIALAFSADGRYVATGSWDGTARIWDTSTGCQIRQFDGLFGWVVAVALSPDNRFVYTATDTGTADKWDLQTGGQLGQIRIGANSDGASGEGRPESATFSRDGRLLLTGRRDNTARLFDFQTGEELAVFGTHLDTVRAVAFSSDDRFILTASGGEAWNWSMKSRSRVQIFTGGFSPVIAAAISVDGKLLVTGEVRTAKVWDIQRGALTRSLRGHSKAVASVAISPDDRTVLTAGFPFGDKMVKLWDVRSAAELQKLSHDKFVMHAALSPDGSLIASGTLGEDVFVWDAATGAEVCFFRLRDSNGVSSVDLSPDNRRVAVGVGQRLVLEDIRTGLQLQVLDDSRRHEYIGAQPGEVVSESNDMLAAVFSPDGRSILTGSRDKTAKIWDPDSGEVVRWFIGHSGPVVSLAFSPDGKRILTGSEDQTARLWDAETGVEIRRFSGHYQAVRSVAFTLEGRVALTSSFDGVRLWEVSTGKELCQLLSFTDGTWAVVDPEGRYDASNGGDVEGLHWVVGNEPIALYQLKERYYDPGLLAKIMGFKKEPLREVQAFRDVAFYPEVKVEPPAPGSTTARVTLTNRGGGIGKVRLLVNGKEIVADARGPKPDPKAPSATLSVDLAGAALVPGKPNTIRVLAWNAEGYLSSRGTEVSWTPEGTTPSSPPELYAIVGGISSYGSDSLRLRYAGKDAEDMATALTVGAKRLFGAEKVHLILLATSTDPNAVPPTKAAFREAFEKAKKARPSDILVVYLAGHGVAFRNEEGGDTYAYLTAEARSTDPAALKDSAVRQQTTITSEELTEWTKAVPALKQVMILDTCAAAAAAEKLVEKRDVTGEQIRALERLKDRTGFHVLMGSAANAVSYEASQYGQGILTYALLQGMRGAALKEQQYVDVSQLFQYAADQVPQLAKNIGGIQRPQIAAPRGSSFDIGQLTSEDKTKIPLAMVRPLVLKPILQSLDDGFDSLALMPAVQRALAATSDVVTRGGRGLVFVDAEELPGALRPSGFYSREGDQITVTVNLVRDGKKLTTLKVQGRAAKIEELGKRVAAEIAAALPPLILIGNWK